MEVAQKGVEAFVAQAMARKVAFAMETVFSHWQPLEDGSVESKIDLIRQMQARDIRRPHLRRPDQRSIVHRPCVDRKCRSSQ